MSLYKVDKDKIMTEHFDQCVEHFRETTMPLHFPHIVEHAGVLFDGNLQASDMPTIISVIITRDDFKEHCKAFQFEDDMKEILK